MTLRAHLDEIFEADRRARALEARLLAEGAPEALSDLVAVAAAEALALDDEEEAELRLMRLADLAAQVPGPAMVDTLIAILGHASPKVRAEAGEALRDVAYERFKEVARAIERALDPSTLVAYRMNGEALTLAHGAPLRLVVPGWAGDHWVKWLTKLAVQKEEAKGFYMQTGYRMPVEKVEPGAAVPPEKMRPATTFPVKSIIGSPADGARTSTGRQKIAGVAFSGEAPIAKVEVSVDDGKTWRVAKLEGEPGVGRWVVFTLELDRKVPGRVRAIARATDKKGNVQPEHPDWNPSGYFWNGWHSVSWEVA